MRIAIIDLGTNSVRFDIHDFESPNQLTCLYRMKEMVRLGENLFGSSKLQASAMERTVRALKKFKTITGQFKVDEIVGAGTSAIREARNSKDFLKMIERNLEIKIRMISGKDEARLIMKGILSFEPSVSHSFGFIDIGGGSTEVGYCNHFESEFLESFNVGAARIRQMFTNDPPFISEIENARKLIRQEFGSVRGFKDWPKVNSLFGASGTIKALSKIMKECGYGKIITYKNLKDLVQEMSTMSFNELQFVPGMEERRVDIMFSGALILEEAMKFFDAKEVVRTKFALREGLLQERLEELKLSESPGN